MWMILISRPLRLPLYLLSISVRRRETIRFRSRMRRDLWVSMPSSPFCLTFHCSRVRPALRDKTSKALQDKDIADLFIAFELFFLPLTCRIRYPRFCPAQAVCSQDILYSRFVHELRNDLFPEPITFETLSTSFSIPDNKETPSSLGRGSRFTVACCDGKRTLLLIRSWRMLYPQELSVPASQLYYLS